MVAMRTSFFFSHVVTFFLVIMVMAALSPSANSQNCAAGLNQLTVCAPFVVPSVGGSSPPNPSSQCCNRLKGLNHDCICNTLNIISKLPSSCSLPPVSCSA